MSGEGQPNFTTHRSKALIYVFITSSNIFSYSRGNFIDRFCGWEYANGTAIRVSAWILCETADILVFNLIKSYKRLSYSLYAIIILIPSIQFRQQSWYQLHPLMMIAYLCGIQRNESSGTVGVIKLTCEPVSYEARFQINSPWRSNER